MAKIDYTYCELREREVINVTDGKKLGRICDVALDCKGRIMGFILPGEKKLFKAITSNENIYIPWECIVKIGSDVILVDLNNGYRQPNNGNVNLLQQ